MIVLTVTNKNNNVYELFSEQCSTISLQIIFVGISKPNVGDKILIHNSLIDRTNENFTQPYVFRLCDEVDIKEIKRRNHPEYIGVKVYEKYYCMKRIYG